MIGIHGVERENPRSVKNGRAGGDEIGEGVRGSR